MVNVSWVVRHRRRASDSPALPGYAGASRTSCRQALTSSRLQWDSDQRAATRRRSADKRFSSHCIQGWKYVRAERRDRLLRIRA